VDLPAVREALDSGQLGGLGLDVLEGDETLLLEEAGLVATAERRRQALLAGVADLLQRPNVVVSPHNAYNSGEAARRIVATTIETIQAYLQGHAINVVSPASWG
jgi:D-lactate dehydrogenase